MIKCTNLNLKYGKKEVLKDVNLSFSDNKITVILGKNGSGKTTLLRCLSYIQQKYNGDIYINDKNIKDFKDKERAQKISLMPQVLPRPAISVETLVSMGRFPYSDDMGRLNSDDYELADKAIKLCEIESLRKNLVCHLSGGERQQSYFAMLYCQNSDILLMDEATSALDALYRKRFKKHLKQLKDTGKTIILTIHDINEALNIADEIILMDKGSIIYQGDVKEFVDSGLIEEKFGLEKKTYIENNIEKYFYL
ncbi:MAG: ABC transporter ATP-binding protein [Erysipelotrichaceae bacterium]|nr:ABC transporter ATP-binding protein [Erysipelotrichaceae bacterium]